RRNPIRRANFDGAELKQRPEFVIVPGTKVEVGPHDADDGIRLAIEQHGSADDEGVGAKLRLPESKAENNFTRLAWSFARGIEGSPQERVHSESREEFTGCGSSANTLRLACSGVGEGILSEADGSKMRKRSLVLASCEVVHYAVAAS